MKVLMLVLAAVALSACGRSEAEVNENKVEADVRWTATEAVRKHFSPIKVETGWRIPVNAVKGVEDRWVVSVPIEATVEGTPIEARVGVVVDRLNGEFVATSIRKLED